MKVKRTNDRYTMVQSGHSARAQIPETSARQSATGSDFIRLFSPSLGLVNLCLSPANLGKWPDNVDLPLHCSEKQASYGVIGSESVSLDRLSQNTSISELLSHVSSRSRVSQTLKLVACRSKHPIRQIAPLLSSMTHGGFAITRCS